MISDERLKRIMREYLLASKLADEANGDVLTISRPMDSEMEDIVINTVANANGQRQIAYMNVNVYVPAIYFRGQYERDGERLETLAEVAGAVLDVYNAPDARFSLVSQSIIAELDGKTHVINNYIKAEILNL